MRPEVYCNSLRLFMLFCAPGENYHPNSLIVMAQTPTTPHGSAADPAVVSAISQMFAEFELVYHNQYHKAFNSKEKEDWAKKLWYSNLKEFSAQQILDAAHRAIKESDYLPTVHGVLKYCGHQGPILPLLTAIDERPPLSKQAKQKAIEKLRKETGI